MLIIRVVLPAIVDLLSMAQFTVVLMGGEGPVVKKWGSPVAACCSGITTNNAFALSVLGWKVNPIVIPLPAWALELV